MTQEASPTLDVDDLALDVFELADSGLAVESLTAGHGMLENAASSGCNSSYCGGQAASCSCGCTPPEYE